MTHAAQIARRICCAGECEFPKTCAKDCRIATVRLALAAHHDLLESPENVERLARAAERYEAQEPFPTISGTVRVILAKMREIGG